MQQYVKPVFLGITRSGDFVTQVTKDEHGKPIEDVFHTDTIEANYFTAENAISESLACAVGAYKYSSEFGVDPHKKHVRGNAKFIRNMGTYYPENSFLIAKQVNTMEAGMRDDFDSPKRTVLEQDMVTLVRPITHVANNTITKGDTKTTEQIFFAIIPDYIAKFKNLKKYSLNGMFEIRHDYEKPMTKLLKDSLSEYGGYIGDMQMVLQETMKRIINQVPKEKQFVQTEYRGI